MSALRSVFKWVAAALGALLPTVGLAMTATLGTSQGRSWVGSMVLAKVNEQIAGRIEMGDMPRLTPWGLELRDVRVRDPESQTVLVLAALRLELSPLELLNDTLHIRLLEVAKGSADVGDLDGPPTRLRAALSPTDAGPKNESSEQGNLEVRIDRVVVDDFEARAGWASSTYSARLGTLVSGGQYGTHTRVDLGALDLELHRDQERLGGLRCKNSAWSSRSGGAVVLHGDVAGAPLSLHASIPPPDQQRPWPVRRVQMALEDLGPTQLDALGLDGSSLLHGPIRLVVKAHEENGALHGTAQLEGPGAPWTVKASARPDAGSIALTLPGTPLRALSPLLPPQAVAGTVTADYRLAASDQVAGVVRWDGLRTDSQPIPAGRIRLAYEPETLTVNDLRFDDVKGDITLEVTHNLAAKRTDVALDLQGVRPASVQGADVTGIVDGKLALHVEGDRLQGDLRMEVRGLGSGEVEVQRMALRAKASGPLNDPRMSASLSVDDARSGKNRLDQAVVDAELPGGQEAMSAVATFRGVDILGRHLDTLTLRGRGDLRSGSAQLIATQAGSNAADVTLQMRSGGGAARRVEGAGILSGWRLAIESLRLSPGLVDLSSLRLMRDNQTVSLRGTLRGPNLRAEARARRVRLSPLAALANVAIHGGTLDAHVAMEGKLEAPDLTADVTLTKVAYGTAPPITASTRAEGSLAKGEASVRIEASVVDGPDRLTLDWNADWRPRQMSADALRRGRHRIAIQLAGMQTVHLAKALQLPPSPVQGAISAKVLGEGSWRDPRGSLELSLTFPHDASHAQAMDVTAKLQPTSASLTALAQERKDVLASLIAELAWPTPGMDGIPRSAKALLQKGLDVKASIPERRLDRLRGPFAELLAFSPLRVPLKMGADVSLASAKPGVSAKARASLQVSSRDLDARCPQDAASELTLEANLERKRLAVQSHAVTHPSGQIWAQAEAPLDLMSLLDGGPLPPLETVVLKARQVALEQLPGLCNLDTGRASADIEGRGVGGPSPELVGQLVLKDMRRGATAPVGARVYIATTPREMHATGGIEVGGKQHGDFEVRVPLKTSPDGLPSVAADTPLKANLRMKPTPVAPFLSTVNAVGQVAGQVSIDARVSGTLQSPHPQADVRLHGLGLSVASLAQPLRDMTGSLHLDGRKLLVKQVEAHDRDGVLRLDGGASMDAQGAGKAVLRVTTERFPLRRQGTIVAEAHTRIDTGATLTDKGALTVTADIHGGRIWLLGDTGNDVQSLDPMPEIRFEADLQQPVLQPLDPPVRLEGLTVTTSKPLWVMHSDFSVQVTSDLRLEGGNAPRVLGALQLVRGEISLLGNPFAIRKGELRFTGDTPPEPQLDVRATHVLPSGEPLHVHITGRATQPQLAFSGAATTVGEALAAMTGLGASADPDAARADAGSFATNMLAGVLSVAARREWGDWVPMLAVKSSSRGIEQVRTGFDASHLIPEFLRGFARGMYVEGVFGREGGGSEPQGLGVGVAADVALPRGFVTSGSYGPGATWSAELGWSP